MSRLANQSIIITGSCRGIGKAIAKRCAQEGASVLIHGLQPELGEAIVQEIGSDRAALCIEDLTHDGAAGRIIDAAVARFGKLDHVVNNAALIAAGTIHDTDADRFNEFLAVNMLAPYLMIRAALPQLESNHGTVLNIGSVNAYCGEPDLLPYSVSKGALMTLTRNLGDTLMRQNGVRVNQINPGWVLTEAEQARKLSEGLPENWYAGLPAEFAPSGRIIRPEEIAAAAVYWLSDECGPVSGQVVDLEQYPMIGRNPPKDIITLTRKF